ncbi:tail fiber assembly protein [Klebsiella pneumoniae]|uniref:tail fiber assembly protein n=1 Tax=Enterobacterales TaxID=91347 RepID=UPI000E5CE566|nr:MULTISPECIES: tail fiber assembly protein [Enterobacterales]MDN2605044.1 tail fiber assembly protein [Klebsiella variicola]AXZ12088.1 tail fiber assembly protein [Klebsiella pneumoniae]MCQ5470513.1 tail fiber assembly protein [Pantoea brenneri]MCS5749517.1 tail fiber assembly protein [Klebsiella quasipneumoniae subsp. quasipneumoniae]MCX9857977.1 tail fiber assembly protein [Klebsiella pneumoniae]
MTKYYSPGVNAFYSIDINGTSIPEDAVEITDEAWLDLLKQQSEGKVIGAGENGIPVANDAPPLTSAQLIEIAESQKASLMAQATVTIAPLQDAVDLDKATDSEKTQLTAWKKYRVLLNRVNTSMAPDITWPYKP